MGCRLLCRVPSAPISEPALAASYSPKYRSPSSYQPSIDISIDIGIGIDIDIKIYTINLSE